MCFVPLFSAGAGKAVEPWDHSFTDQAIIPSIPFPKTENALCRAAAQGVVVCSGALPAGAGRAIFGKAYCSRKRAKIVAICARLA